MRMTVSIQMIDSGEPCAEMVYTKSNGDVVGKTDGGEYQSDADCVRAAKEDLRDTLKFFSAYRPTVALYIVRVDGRIVKQSAFDMKVA